MLKSAGTRVLAENAGVSEQAHKFVFVADAEFTNGNLSQSILPVAYRQRGAW